ncbi:MAG: MoaD/ThiS family protein [Chloroflexi bacterium]|nr:MAG: MoaD/ThiS family protein [Chloroflexota bacterium]
MTNERRRLTASVHSSCRKMKIHVTAYGDLRRYLPADQRDGGADLELLDGSGIIHMLDALHLPYHSTWLVGVNDQIVALDHTLRDGDEIELMLPIGGGSS